MTGTMEDHHARFEDYRNTKAGSFVCKRSKLMHVFKILLERYAAEAAKKAAGSKVIVLIYAVVLCGCLTFGFVLDYCTHKP